MKLYDILRHVSAYNAILKSTESILHLIFTYSLLFVLLKMALSVDFSCNFAVSVERYPMLLKMYRWDTNQLNEHQVWTRYHLIGFYKLFIHLKSFGAWFQSTETVSVIQNEKKLIYFLVYWQWALSFEWRNRLAAVSGTLQLLPIKGRIPFYNTIDKSFCNLTYRITNQVANWVQIAEMDWLIRFVLLPESASDNFFLFKKMYTHYSLA